MNRNKWSVGYHYHVTTYGCLILQEVVIALAIIGPIFLLARKKIVFVAFTIAGYNLSV